MEFETTGKILMLGGYLVLFPEYFGVVLGINAHFKVRATEVQSEYLVIVSQRFNLEANYNVETGVCVSGSTNKYIEAGLLVALKMLATFNKPISPYRLEIISDDVFYEGGKTGLGSSACTVTTLVKALLTLGGINDERIIHLASQMANSVAQNKIGSGFDISACLYKSHLYNRIRSPLVKCSLDSLSQATVLQEIAQEHWDSPKPFQLPEGFQLVLCRGSGGSSTVECVKRVLQ